MKVNDEPIVVEQSFSCSIECIWNAITEASQMKKWFFENIEEFNAEIGFKTQFVIKNENRVFTHLWELTEVIRNRKIVYNWKYEEYPGDSFVTFELFELPQKTKLVVSTKVIEDFPDSIPEFKRESCVQGWAYFIKGNLKKYIDEQCN